MTKWSLWSQSTAAPTETAAAALSSSESSGEEETADIDDLLYLAQRCLIQHHYPKARTLLEKAASLGSSDACLTLASILYSDTTDACRAQVAAKWYLKGLELEGAKSSPFASSRQDAQKRTARRELSSIAESPRSEHGEEPECINLEATSHLAAGLCALYRLGKVRPAVEMDLSSNGKEKEADPYEQGARLATRLLQHPALIRKREAFANGKDDVVWVPSSVTSSAKPERSVSLTSTQQLRRSIYASLCYTLAIVTFPQSADHVEAGQWFAKVVSLENESGGPGTRNAEELVAKARVRLDMIRCSQQKEQEMLDHLKQHHSHGHRSTDHQRCDFQHRLLSAQAALDSPDALSAEKHFDFKPLPVRKASSVPLPPASLPTASVLTNGVHGLHKKPVNGRRASKFSLHDALSDGTRSSTSSPVNSPPTTAPSTQRFPFPTSQKERPLKSSKSALDLLRPRAQSLRPMPSISSLSAELIGIAPSHHRHRAQSTSLLSPDSPYDRSSFHKTASSASIQSLPHFQTFLAPTARPAAEAPASKRSSMLSQAIRNSVLLNALSEMLPSTDDDPDAEDDHRRPLDSGDAASALEGILKRDLIAERDLQVWEEQYETDEESWPSRSLTPDNDGRDVFHSRPLPQVESPTPAPRFTRSKKPIEIPVASEALQVPTATRPKRVQGEMDPLLAALEAASKINVKTKCSVCRKRGSNFPACRQCGTVYCSRSCRLAATSCGHAKR